MLCLLCSAQLVFALVRQYETARGDEKFDFILRVRPDFLFVQPLPVALGVNVSRWSRNRLMTFGGDAASFALVPSGPLAAVYFRSFTAASSCIFREKGGDERLPDAFAPSMQCASLELWENFARCVVVSNLLYHGLPKVLDAPRRPALIARMCNLNATTRRPAWPAWPMPPGETCVTTLDGLKRPRVLATLRPGSAGARSSGGIGIGSWEVTLFLVGCAMCFAAYTYRERLRDDALALAALLAYFGAMLLEQARELLGPERVEALQQLMDQARAAVAPKPAYAPPAADDEEDA